MALIIYEPKYQTFGEGKRKGERKEGLPFLTPPQSFSPHLEGLILRLIIYHLNNFLTKTCIRIRVLMFRFNKMWINYQNL